MDNDMVADLDVLQSNRCIHLGVLRVSGRRYGLRLSVCRGYRDGVVGGDAGNGSHDVFHPIVRVGAAHHEHEQEESCEYLFHVPSPCISDGALWLPASLTAHRPSKNLLLPS